MQGALALSLVGEVRSHKLHGAAKKKKNPILRQVLGKRKGSFIEEAGDPGRRWTHVPKIQFPHVDQGARAFQGEFQECFGGGGRRLCTEQHS